MIFGEWSTRARVTLYLGALVGVVALLGGSALGFLGWQRGREGRAQVLMSEYHLATLGASAAGQMNLLRLMEHLRERARGSEAEQLEMNLHLDRYGLADRVTQVTALQQSYAEPIFSGTVERIGRSAREIDAALDRTPTAAAAGSQELAYELESLSGSWEQLRRLHQIAIRQLSTLRAVRARAEQRAIAVFLWVVIPVGALLVYGLARLALHTIALQELAEEQVRQLAQDLEHRVAERTAELKLAHEQLARRERLTLLGQITGTVSHELRNPLSTVRLTVQSLSARLRDVDPALKSLFERAERSLARCNQVVSEMLDFSRSPPLNPISTDVTSWLLEVVGDQRIPPWLELRYDLPPDGTMLHLDRERLRRAVINVVDNAVEAMEGARAGTPEPRPMRLEVRCAIRDQRLLIVVADTGPGMKPETLGQIFEPLFTTKAHGIGLGMPTVKQIMEASGGGIDVSSTYGQGTEVTLWLPLPA